MTCISWFSDIGLYLEDYLMYFGIMSQYDMTFDLKINVQVTVTYILWSSDFALIS